MKTVLMTLALLTLVVSTANARPERGHGPPQDRNPAERLTRALDLNDDQANEVTAIFDEAKAKHEAMREKSHESFGEIRASTDARIMEVLNEEQQLRFTDMKNQRSERGRGKGKRKGKRARRQN